MPYLNDPAHPVTQILNDEAVRDHALAKGRGERALDISRLVLAALDGHGLVTDNETALKVVWAAVCDGLFPYDASIDIPNFNRR